MTKARARRVCRGEHKKSFRNMSDDEEWEESGADWAVPDGVATSLFGDFTGPADEYVV